MRPDSPSVRRATPAVVAVLACCAVACTDANGDPDAGSSLPPAVCHEGGSRWSPGVRAFVDATEAWELDALDVQGIRLSAADLDGDGWTDLVVRRVGGTETWVLRNTGRGSFEDVTKRSGFLTARAAGNEHRAGEVVVFADVDNDGDVDAYVGLSTANAAVAKGETSELLLNDGTGRFTLGPADNALRLQGRIDMPAGASFVDFDRDGFVDLWVGQHNTPEGMLQTDRLWRGTGDGSFTDATAAAGLVTKNWNSMAALNEGQAHSRAWSTAACDLDGDGASELLVASYGRAPNHLWQAIDDGASVTYANRSVASGYAYDDDRTWQDNQFARCYCEANRDAEGCEGVPAPLIACDLPNWNHASDRQPYRLGGNSGTTLCADVDNDGDLDLFTTEIRHWWAGAGSDRAEWLENTGEAQVRFTRPGRAATGLEIPHDGVDWDEGIMSASVLDFDNDGWLDLYVGASDYPGNRGLLFHQDAPFHFQPVPLADGIDHFRSHGSVVADFDRDGDLDLVVGHSLARCSGSSECVEPGRIRLFENLSAPGNWLQLVLEGAEGTNRSAIGARVTVTAGGLTQTREVSGGFGHYGAQDERAVHVGLGAACEAEVTITWPNRARTTDTLRLPAGHRFLVREGGEVVTIPPSSP